MKDFETLNSELNAYHPSLNEKTQIVVLNKMDLPSVRERAADIKKQFEEIGHRLYMISGKTGEGLDQLILAISLALGSVSDKADEQ